VQILDIAIGIPEQQLSRIFEEFYRIDDSTHNDRQGLGLGLVIVNRFARFIDVQINVRSVIDKGSTFEAIIPCGV
jgi:signal transduction histidine kinase